MSADCQVMAMKDQEDPSMFIRGLVLSLLKQKQDCNANGKTDLRLHWRNGTLDCVDISDSQSVRFCDKKPHCSD